MKRPVIGIIGNVHLLNDQYPVHAGGSMNSCAVAHVAHGLPLLIPADPNLVSVDDLLEACDGFVLTGGRPNVHPGPSSASAAGFRRSTWRWAARSTPRSGNCRAA